ncbi:DUF3237 family protein [Rhodococcus sp. BP-252]|uniref:DUF3237 domain-containing protein n=1 Tax=Rhodococcoides kyotonense TaxID=398843 RepID=A0A177YFK0_9NOCA|nr:MULTISPECIES: DUF3237 family protein [Rhodococcus]MBY6414466.1 DUF3237 family protein [Rhodococcus sp. BP-320]MBY6419224.1 DUF3237 family protein [Rhodococcus sp. BP-321]MBY6423933.1 DUF3237 family protein [Rhodococcus sp. BP-324]MBY6429315.1 DUF3237 family protein [Rhodococcus sp. BP-323]MBY6434276.1 DUF3237 family protein [Rhodococcus sp. BP-322]
MSAPIAPTLEPILRLGLTLGVPIDVGSVPGGARVVTPILGGAAPGPDIEGTLAGSASVVGVTRPDGCTEFSAELTLELTDGGYLSLTYRGFQFGPAEVIESLNGTEEVDPATYYFRGTLDIATSVPQFTYLNRALVVTSGTRSAESVVLDAFLVT